MIHFYYDTIVQFIKNLIPPIKNKKIKKYNNGFGRFIKQFVFSMNSYQITIK